MGSVAIRASSDFLKARLPSTTAAESPFRYSRGCRRHEAPGDNTWS